MGVLIFKREKASLFVYETLNHHLPKTHLHHLPSDDDIDPIPKKKLKELLTKMKLSAKDILRTKELIYKELKLAGRDLSNDELIDLMVKYPNLIQRPIVEKGAKAILARPAERIREIL